MAAAKIVHVLLQAPGPLCEDCLADRVAESAEEIASALARLRQQLKLVARRSACVGCRRVMPTFSIA